MVSRSTELGGSDSVVNGSMFASRPQSPSRSADSASQPSEVRYSLESGPAPFASGPGDLGRLVAVVVHHVGG